MTSEEEKPMSKQFLRVQREDDEDTWISGEELKTEGSSGSDDEIPRRKVSHRKSRRRRSEGYTPPESRLSLPNLNENKTGIAFHLSRPLEEGEDADLKADRFSIGAELSKEETAHCKIEAAMSRMRTRSSLDKTYELDECLTSESDWRPKRGSCPNIPKKPSSKATIKKHRFSLPRLTEKKTIRFSDEVQKFDPLHEEFLAQGDSDVADSDQPYGTNEQDLNVYLTGDRLGEDREAFKFSDTSFRDFGLYDDEDDFDVDRNILKNFPINITDYESEHSTENKKHLKLPNFGEDNIDKSVSEFVNEMNVFYNEMSNKLKTLKKCPVLEHSVDVDINLVDNTFMKETNLRPLFKNLKKTPQVKRTLSLISKMDTDISDTITKFREERSQRIEIQRKLMQNIPRERESQFFVQLCDFEAKSDSTTNRNKNGQQLKHRKLRRERRLRDKNFIEINIELAKLGMNYSLSDEQKQRLEKILQDECANQTGHCQEKLSVEIRRANNMTLSERTIQDENDMYASSTLNAYRLCDEHKQRLIEIDSALQAFNDNESKTPSESSIGVNIVRTLKEIDEKLEALSGTNIQDGELLKKCRRRLFKHLNNTDQHSVDE